MKTINLHPVNGLLIVYGNCEVCKDRIEKAALSISGVDTANWNISDNKLLLSFNHKSTSLDEISEVISQAGYRTNLHGVDRDFQEHIPDCCKS